ncbi:MAG TPA: DEAD/DEAH box helicase [Candidatus Polarisedimenticolia bacterium]|nr:DEAD/DEAH box helicase [Candidatus Polarisedimenticolia bacterium]
MPFSRLNLNPELLKSVHELGFKNPTTIQEQAIPPALSGRDLLACASTGSGKTAAFLLPILQRLAPRPRGVTRALILTPTRELAAQVHEDLEELATHTPVTGAAVFGGVGMGPQEHALRSGVDVIVATPGRLLDHLRHPYARLAGLEVLVLDEADRMLDMGFLPDVRRILQRLPRKRQTLFFSATMPREIVSLSREMLHNPATINLERKAAPAAGIRQAVYPVRRDLKPALLAELLERNVVSDAIVFTRTKHRANQLAQYLERRGIETGRIHGNRSQSQRTAALAGFKAGKHRVLVATDIVARGIDVEQLGHVINFDVPETPDAYIHRVGRTARAEATGDAFTFIAPEEEVDLRAIERALGAPLLRVTLPEFDYEKKSEGRLEASRRPTQGAQRASRGGGRSGGGHRRDGSHSHRAGGGSGSGRHHGGGQGSSSGRHHEGGQASSSARRHGGGQASSGGHRSRSRSGRDSRMQAILDRHAPMGEGDAQRPASRRRRRRR